MIVRTLIERTEPEPPNTAQEKLTSAVVELKKKLTKLILDHGPYLNRIIDPLLRVSAVEPGSLGFASLYEIGSLGFVGMDTNWQDDMERMYFIANDFLKASMTCVISPISLVNINFASGQPAVELHLEKPGMNSYAFILGGNQDHSPTELQLGLQQLVVRTLAEHIDFLNSCLSQLVTVSEKNNWSIEHLRLEKDMMLKKRLQTGSQLLLGFDDLIRSLANKMPPDEGSEFLELYEQALANQILDTDYLSLPVLSRVKIIPRDLVGRLMLRSAGKKAADQNWKRNMHSRSFNHGLVARLWRLSLKYAIETSPIESISSVYSKRIQDANCIPWQLLVNHGLL